MGYELQPERTRLVKNFLWVMLTIYVGLVVVVLLVKYGGDGPKAVQPTAAPSAHEHELEPSSRGISRESAEPILPNDQPFVPADRRPIAIGRFSMPDVQPAIVQVHVLDTETNQFLPIISLDYKPDGGEWTHAGSTGPNQKMIEVTHAVGLTRYRCLLVGGELVDGKASVNAGYNDVNVNRTPRASVYLAVIDDNTGNVMPMPSEWWGLVKFTPKEEHHVILTAGESKDPQTARYFLKVGTYKIECPPIEGYELPEPELAVLMSPVDITVDIHVHRRW